MDFLTWNDTIKLILLIIFSGLMIALMLAAFAAALCASMLAWKGMKAKGAENQKGPVQNAIDKLRKVEDEDDSEDFDTDE